MGLGLGSGMAGSCDVCVSCESGFFVYMADPGICIVLLSDLYLSRHHPPLYGGTVRQQTTPANRDHLYPDSLLFVSAGFLPRISSQRLN